MFQPVVQEEITSLRMSNWIFIVPQNSKVEKIKDQRISYSIGMALGTDFDSSWGVIFSNLPEHYDSSAYLLHDKVPRQHHL